MPGLSPSTAIAPLSRTSLLIVALFLHACSDGTGPDRPALRDQIVFASNRDGLGRQLYVMRPDGGAVQRLTTVSGAPSAPAVSPDGRWIAFAKGTPGGLGDIYIMNAAGGELVNVTNSPYEDGFPAWSPDGTELVFTSTRFDQPGNVPNTDVYRIGRDGTGERRLTTDPAEDLTPTWSPDGELIAFVTTRDGNHEIYTMAPDGSRLAFSSLRTPTRSIVIADRAGGGATSLIAGNTASWSGDGSELVYDAGGDIWRIAASGGEPVNLTASDAVELSPVWAR
jgi:TolB protein